MKQFFAKALSLLGVLLLLLVFAALPLFAQETATPSSSPAAGIQSDYMLPYPGILPDNPLYIFKAMRDKVISILISDPKSKTSFDLLQADKRLAAAFAMSKEPQHSDDLIIQTISKGENYFSFAVGEAGLAKQQGEEINGLLNQLYDASQKHLQVIAGIQHSVSQKDSEQLQLEAKRVQKFAQMVNKLRSH